MTLIGILRELCKEKKANDQTTTDTNLEKKVVYLYILRSQTFL